MPVKADIGIEAACVSPVEDDVRKHLLEPRRLPEVLRELWVVQSLPPAVPHCLHTYTQHSSGQCVCGMRLT